MAKSGLTGDKIFYEFDPFKEVGMKVPRGTIKAAKEEIATFVKEQVLSYVGEGQSPISGGKWKRTLSPEYKKFKSQSSSATFANMELTGDMLDALDVVSKSGKTISIEITGKEQVAKADGHNNFSGDSHLPARQFIPKADQKLKKDILDGIKQIIESFDGE